MFKFYKSSTSWIVGVDEDLNFPTNKLMIRYLGPLNEIDQVRIMHLDGKQIFQGNVTDITKNIGGNKYATYVEFITAVSDYFTTGLPTEQITDLIEAVYVTKIKKADGTTINPATEESLALIKTAIENSGGTTLKAFSVEITRPANTTVYSANDVVADVSAAFVAITNVAKANGTGVRINRVRIQTDDTGVAGKKFNLHLYKEATTFIADNAAFAIVYANASKRVGTIPVVMGTGNMGTVGMNDYNQIILNPTAKDVYWILETVDGFTPSANSTKFQITIDCELSNN